MKRRSLLATGASLAVAAATAGCLGRTGVGDGRATDDTTTTDDEKQTTAGSGSEDAGDDPHFDDDAAPDVPECPDLYDDADNVDAVVCAGEASDERLSFGQSAERVARGDALEATLVNDAADSVGLNPYDWAVHRRVSGGDWERVDRGPVPEPWTELSRGDRMRWRVRVGDSDVQPHPDDQVYGGNLALDAGAYAFAVTAEVGGQRVAFVAPFAVVDQ